MKVKELIESNGSTAVEIDGKTVAESEADTRKDEVVDVSEVEFGNAEHMEDTFF